MLALAQLLVLGDASCSLMRLIVILDLIYVSSAFLVPLWFAVRISNKLIAIGLGTVWVWGLMILSGQYNLATDPNYDSFAPGLSIGIGWLPGLIYASLCVLFDFILRVLIATYGQDRGDS